MSPDDAVPIIIRNQCHRWWPAPVMLSGLAIFVVSAVLAYDQLEPELGKPFDGLFLLGFALVFVVLWLAALNVINRQPAPRVKLGDELCAFPVGRVSPDRVDTVRFERDPDEDFGEPGWPVPWCKLTIQVRKRKFSMCGRKTHLLVSFGDAVRARHWAERWGVAVIDPEGFSRGSSFHGGRN